MKLIKFRAWCPDLGRMLNVRKIDFVSEQIEISSDHLLYYYLFQIKLLEFTGIQDIHGNKIFEGDILAAPNIKIPRRWEVIWDYNGFYLYLHTIPPVTDPIHGMRHDLEIIGNKFENPELMGA